MRVFSLRGSLPMGLAEKTHSRPAGGAQLLNSQKTDYPEYQSLYANKNPAEVPPTTPAVKCPPLVRLKDRGVVLFTFTAGWLLIQNLSECELSVVWSLGLFALLKDFAEETTRPV